MSLIVGIDLGTSTSEIAFINEDGEPQLIPNHLGDFITPSVVHIKENGEILVGRPAAELLLLEPENTFMEVKRLMGTDTVLKSRGRTYNPVEMSSFIVKYLVKCAADFLKQPVTRAVITVPAYFTDAQRKETIHAGELAGLTVERIINEPTAASLDYGISNTSVNQNIIVYDFGGGTLDVTVLELFDGVIEVKSSCGNSALGGKDIDKKIQDSINEKIKREYRLDVSQDLRCAMRIKKISEECKIALSSSLSFEIDLPFLYNENGKSVNYSDTLTRKKFEELIWPDVSSTAKQIKTALMDADLKADDLDLLLLVGGTTKIPLISEFLISDMGLSPQSLIDPDLGVVRGAAIQAGIISGRFAETDNEVVITDVCPYSLSTEVLTGDFFLGITHCDILINRNTTIPVTVQKIYQTAVDNQKSVLISAYQGESTVPEENILLNKLILSGVPAAKAGKEDILVRFSYDTNGILSVTGEIVSNGKSVNVEIDTYRSGSGVDLSTWKDCKKAKSYRAVIKKAEKFLANADPISEYEDEFSMDTEIAQALEELKRGIIGDWDDEVLDEIKELLLELL